MGRRPKKIFSESHLAPGDAATVTSTIKAVDMALDRVSVYVIPIDEPVTVEFRVRFVTDGGPDTVPLKTTTAALGTANADEAFPWTSEDLIMGDLDVVILTGTPGPARVEVIAFGLN